MGWLEGVLTGYADRHYAIQQEKREAAEKAAEREGQVLNTLLNSEYKDIQDYAGAAMLDLANPKRRKGGLAGWMGEIEQSPYLDMIRRTRERIAEDPEYADANRIKNYYPWLGQRPGQEAGGAKPATPSVPTPGGQVPANASAAQPTTTPVQGVPLTPVTPAPPRPPARNVSFFPPEVQGAGPPGANPFRLPPTAGAPPPTPPGYPSPQALFQRPQPAAAPAPAQAAAPGAPPTPPAGAVATDGAPLDYTQAGVSMTPPAGPPLPVSQGPPPPPGQVAVGAPGATTQPVGPAQRVPPTRTQLPGIFPTTADMQRRQAQAAVQGKIDAYAEMYKLQGMGDQEAYTAAAKLFEQDMMSTTSRPYQTIAGELVAPDGSSTPAFATFNVTNKEYTLLDGRPIPLGYEFRPRPQASMVNAGGVYYQQAARKLFPGGNVPYGREAEVVAEAEKIAASVAAATTTARGEANIAIKKKTPIGVVAGRILNKDPLTTLEDLEGQIPLDETQKARFYQIGQVEESIKRMEELLPVVFPDVPVGVLGRLQSAYQLGKGWLEANPDLAALDAAIQVSLGQIVKLGGDTGQLSKSDIDRAQAAVLSLTPSVLGGDTLTTARARLGVLQELLAKAKATPIGTYDAEYGRAPRTSYGLTPTGKPIPMTPDYVEIDGVGYYKGKPLG